MYTAKDLAQYAAHLNVLYVEDDLALREETSYMLEPFFKSIRSASDGLEGLELYNKESFDLVITDINMPKMNGLKMIEKIKEINPEQKIVAISAHNEPEVLIGLIKDGTSSFILKPIIQSEVINALYPVCRDAYAQILNIELVEELNSKNRELEEQVRALQARGNTIDTKHSQLEKLLKIKEVCKESVDAQKIRDYFSADEDEGDENVVFLQDDGDELLECFQEIPEKLALAITHNDAREVTRTADLLSKAASVLLHYTPYLDSLSESMAELSMALQEHPDMFMMVLMQDSDGVLRLFDAVSTDMERYIERFSHESLAMKNTHHIHEPTTLSIRQIMSMFVPADEDEGDIEFFI